MRKIPARSNKTEQDVLLDLTVNIQTLWLNSANEFYPNINIATDPYAGKKASGNSPHIGHS